MRSKFLKGSSSSAISSSVSSRISGKIGHAGFLRISLFLEDAAGALYAGGSAAWAVFSAGGGLSSETGIWWSMAPWNIKRVAISLQ